MTRNPEGHRRWQSRPVAAVFLALLLAALALPPAGVNAGDAASSLQVTLTAMQLMGYYSTFLDLLTFSGGELGEQWQAVL